MENTTQNRYIYAVTRHLPKEMRPTVEAELSAQLAQKPEAGLEEIIKEVGRPEDVALKYLGSERTSFISGVYYLMYKRVLMTVLPIVAAVLIVLAALGFLVLDVPTLPGLTHLGEFGAVTAAIGAIADIIGHLFFVFGIITIVFAVMDYKKVDLYSESTELPGLPAKEAKVSIFWSIFSIAFSVSATVVLLGFPQIIRGIFPGTGWILFFDVDVLRGLWLPIIAWTVIEIITEVFALLERTYTKRLAAVYIVGGVFQIFFAVTVFGNAAIINPEIVSLLHYHSPIAIDPNLPILAVVLCVIIFEALDAVWTAYKK